MSDIEVYEFSRAFDGIKKIDNYGWVSGGYSPEKISHANQPVPEEIRRAVFANLFALNDNYPPNEGELALIAREIPGKNQGVLYAVLAVANRQRDDGGRPTIGYRYFWIVAKNQNNDYDGILALLTWWGCIQSERKLYFDMEKAGRGEIPGSIERISGWARVNLAQDPNYSQLQDQVVQAAKIPQLQNLSTRPSEKWDELWTDFHFVASGLSHRAQSDVAWAWNVRRLLQPGSFISVACATAEDCASIESVQRLLPNVADFLVRDASEIVSGEESPYPLAHSSPQRYKLLIKDEQLKRALKNAALNPDNIQLSDVEVVLAALVEDHKRQPNDLVDRRLNQPDSPELGHRYYQALLALVIPDHRQTSRWITNFLEKLKTSRNGQVDPSSDDNNILELQNKFSYLSNKIFLDYRNKERNFSEEISEAFTIFLSRQANPDEVSPLDSILSQTVDTNLYNCLNKVFQAKDEQSYKKVSFLLLQGIWLDRFFQYSSQVWDDIYTDYGNKDGKDHPLEDTRSKDFPHEIRTRITHYQKTQFNISKVYESHKKNQKTLVGYLWLAKLFEGCNHTALSQLFYIFSGNSPYKLDEVKDSVKSLFYDGSSMSDGHSSNQGNSSSTGQISDTGFALIADLKNLFCENVQVQLALIAITSALSFAMRPSLESVVIIGCVILVLFVVTYGVLLLANFSGSRSGQRLHEGKIASRFLAYLALIWLVVLIGKEFVDLGLTLNQASSPNPLGSPSESVKIARRIGPLIMRATMINDPYEELDQFKKLDPKDSKIQEYIKTYYIPDLKSDQASKQFELVYQYLSQSSNQEEFQRAKQDIRTHGIQSLSSNQAESFEHQMNHLIKTQQQKKERNQEPKP